MLDENFPDRYELLRDENTHLKKAHKELEEQIKLIAIKLKRQVGQIKTDRNNSKAPLNQDFEREFNNLYDEQIKLQEEERVLAEKIK